VISSGADNKVLQYDGFHPKARIVTMGHCFIDSRYLAQWHLGTSQAMIVPDYYSWVETGTAAITAGSPMIALTAANPNIVPLMTVVAAGILPDNSVVVSTNGAQIMLNQNATATNGSTPVIIYDDPRNSDHHQKIHTPDTIQMLTASNWTAEEWDLMLAKLAAPNAAFNGLSTVSDAATQGNVVASNPQVNDPNRWRVIGNPNVRIH
jgi:hypothetical protein